MVTYALSLIIGLQWPAFGMCVSVSSVTVREYRVARGRIWALQNMRGDTFRTSKDMWLEEVLCPESKNVSRPRDGCQRTRPGEKFVDIVLVQQFHGKYVAPHTKAVIRGRALASSSAANDLSRRCICANTTMMATTTEGRDHCPALIVLCSTTHVSANGAVTLPAPRIIASHTPPSQTAAIAHMRDPCQESYPVALSVAFARFTAVPIVAA